MHVVEKQAERRESDGKSVSVSTGQEGAGQKKVLFYRNPMNPTITSPVPMKDEMGMEYVPVYANEAAPASSGVAGMATVQITSDGIHLSGVQTEPAVVERVARSVRTVGTVTADETRVRHVHTKTAGWIEKLFVNFTGQLVRKGQPILSMYSQELLASQQEFLRARETAAKFAASELPEVRIGGEELLQSAEQRLRLFDVPEYFIEVLKRTGQPQRAVTLLAPVSGFVTAKEVFEGQQVEPGDTIVAGQRLFEVAPCACASNSPTVTSPSSPRCSPTSSCRWMPPRASSSRTPR